MASENNFQAISKQKSKNLTSAMGLTPVKNITPAAKVPVLAARTQTQTAAINAGRGSTPNPVTTPPPPPPPPPGDGTGEVQYGAQTLDNPAPAAPDTSIETLMKSPEYLARERALAAAMNAFTQGQGTDLERYNRGYEQNLSELGYDPTSGKFDLGELLAMGQRATTSGKAHTALRNDFAARGMLQSGAYLAQRGVLENQLMKQREALDENKATFLKEQNKALLAQQAQAEQQRQAALDAARQSILNSMGA